MFVPGECRGNLAEHAVDIRRPDAENDQAAEACEAWIVGENRDIRPAFPERIDSSPRPGGDGKLAGQKGTCGEEAFRQHAPHMPCADDTDQRPFVTHT